MQVDQKPDSWDQSRLYLPTFTDMTLVVGPSENQTTFQTHRIILASQSAYFKTACTNHHFTEARDGKIELPFIDPAVMEILLKHLYGGGFKLPIRPVSPAGIEAALAVMEAADYLMITGFGDQLATDVLKEAQIMQHLVPGHSIGAGAMDQKCERNRLDILNRCYKLGTRVEMGVIMGFIKAARRTGQYHSFFTELVKFEDLHGDLSRDLLVALYKSGGSAKGGFPF